MNPNQRLEQEHSFNMSGGAFFLFNILMDFFVELYPVIKKKRRRPDVTPDS